MSDLGQLAHEIQRAFDSSDYGSADALIAEAEHDPTFRSPEAAASRKTIVLTKARLLSSRGKHDAAFAAVSDALTASPGDVDLLFFAGRFAHAMHTYDLALHYYLASLLNGRKPGPVNMHLAEVMHAMSANGFGHAIRLPGREAAAYGQLALEQVAISEKERGVSERSLALRARIAIDSNDLDSLSGIIADARDFSVAEQRKLQKSIFTTLISIGHERFAFEHRALFSSVSTLVDRTERRYRTSFQDTHEATSESEVAIIRATDISKAAKVRLLDPRIIYSDYLVISPSECGDDELREWARRSIDGLPARLSGVGIGLDANDCRYVAAVAVKTDVLLDLIQTLRESDASWLAITTRIVSHLRLAWTDASTFPAALPRPDCAQDTLPIVPRAKTPSPGVAIVLTRSGAKIRGGGERFAADAAALYADLGFEVLLADMLATSPQEFGQIRRREGEVSTATLAEDPRLFRQFVLRHDVRLVHVVSGFGHFILDALRGLGVKVVYGIHFWRELLKTSSSNPSCFAISPRTSAVVPEPAFQRILHEADAVYANSDFTHDVVKASFDVVLPVVPSCSAPVVLPERTADRDGHILLVNCRPDKGWDLFLQLAAALPQRRFVAYANQSSRFKARADVFQRGLLNVEVRHHTDSLDQLYGDVALAVVPSYQFVETFGRVPVEAGRYGVPVLVADAGNLAEFAHSGLTTLPEDIDTWVTTIKRLLEDPIEYDREVAAARSFSTEYSPELFRSRLKSVITGLMGERQLLVCGAGIGNVLHTTPAVDWLVRQVEHPIDVLVLGDHKGIAPLLANNERVVHVFSHAAHVRSKGYADIYCTYSVTAPTPNLLGDRQHVARRTFQFDPSGDEHEVEMNLRFMSQTLGKDLCDGDTSRYYMGNFSHDPVASGRVVIHAGSKGGKWASKQWPHYEELARWLQGIGLEVVSVGVPDEYVQGTIDRTGLTIEEMAGVVASATLLVSNDSGVMNMGNAIGVPMVALFAPTNPRTRGPRRSLCRILLAPTTCAPCERTDHDRLANGTCKCIGFISVESVMMQVLSLLDARDTVQ